MIEQHERRTSNDVPLPERDDRSAPRDSTTGINTLGKANVEQRTAPPTAGFDQPFHAAIACLTGGISPTALSLAYTDWLQHLALSPDKQIELVSQAMRAWSAPPADVLGSVGSDKALAPDKRFADPAWQRWPFNTFYQNFLLAQAWWRTATTGIPGVSKHHEDVVSFVARQALDVVSPTNFALTNPLVLERTLRAGGANFAQGALNAAQDVTRSMNGAPPAGVDAFQVGRDVAITPGKVVFRNRLIELIQYAPATDEVYPEPILIVSAWIMKYYILDLSPANSLVRYLVENGHTVFVISWRNPTGSDRDLGLEDYRRLGFMAALDAVSAIVPGHQVHAVGYCLGGTLLTIAAAAMARDGDRRLGSLTLFATQTDFTQAGELMLFIDDDQVQFLEDLMAERGFLDARQMAGAFALLRSNDLIWSAMVHEYLMGERPATSDLMAWNADCTRMPYRMHSEYLRTMFVNNDLAEARFIAGGKPVSLRDIRGPLFAVSTLADHVAPWRSVYKIAELTSTDTTFVLSSGGHNVGIVNPPGHPNRHYQLAEHEQTALSIDPDRWQAAAPQHAGSWWPAWADWLVRRSGALGSVPNSGAAGYPPLCDAPGTYVFGT